MVLQTVAQIATEQTLIYIIDATTNLQTLDISKSQQAFVAQQIAAGQKIVPVTGTRLCLVVKVGENTETPMYELQESLRTAGAKATITVNSFKVKQVSVSNETSWPDAAWFFCEGMALANYQFLKYKEQKDKITNTLQQINIPEDSATKKEVKELQNIVKAVYNARNLVNEPLMYLTAVQLGNEVKKMGKSAGFKVTVWDKQKITKNKMGGILAVNKGSVDPPSFSILEWSPRNAVNEAPIVLVGKGVVYDTGGLSLKPTSGMDFMKCDMGGAAAVAGALYAIAANKLPVKVIGLIPATDNRPGLNAYVPGDVITMHSGKTVEVLNTDAEGRMLLADALSYAKSLQPSLVIDIATLTGTALSIIGQKAMLIMANEEADNELSQLQNSGMQVFERLWQLPLWDEYQDQLKSDIADIKNVGGKFAGCITAGKFLQNFTDYPWMHIDMAPMGWNFASDTYRLKNGTGAGVRLFYHFIKEKTKVQ